MKYLLIIAVPICLLGCKNPVAGNAVSAPWTIFSKQEVSITNFITSSVTQVSTTDANVEDAIDAQLPEALKKALPEALLENGPIDRTPAFYHPNTNPDLIGERRPLAGPTR